MIENRSQYGQKWIDKGSFCRYLEHPYFSNVKTTISCNSYSNSGNLKAAQEVLTQLSILTSAKNYPKKEFLKIPKPHIRFNQKLRNSSKRKTRDTSDLPSQL